MFNEPPALPQAAPRLPAPLVVWMVVLEKVTRPSTLMYTPMVVVEVKV
jgi:hypothetical protein